MSGVGVADTVASTGADTVAGTIGADTITCTVGDTGTIAGAEIETC